MRLTIGNYEIMVRRVRKPRSKRVTYCQSYEQLSEAVRAAGIDIWQDKDSFRWACADAGIEVDTASGVYFLEAPVILRNAELDDDERLINPVSEWSSTGLPFKFAPTETVTRREFNEHVEGVRTEMGVN